MDSNKRPETMKRITTPELAAAFIDEQIAAVRAQVGNKKVLLALSGGVDSSVVAALLIKAIGKQLVCVHVNHGLMRKGESENVVEVFRNQLDANLIQPRIVAGSVGLKPLYVLLAIMVGSGLFGFVGILICVPVTAIIRMLILDYLKSLNGKDTPLVEKQRELAKEKEQ